MPNKILKRQKIKQNTQNTQTISLPKIVICFFSENAEQNPNSPFSENANPEPSILRSFLSHHNPKSLSQNFASTLSQRFQPAIASFRSDSRSFSPSLWFPLPPLSSFSERNRGGSLLSSSPLSLPNGFSELNKGDFPLSGSPLSLSPL